MDKEMLGNLLLGFFDEQKRRGGLHMPGRACRAPEDKRKTGRIEGHRAREQLGHSFVSDQGR